MKANELRIGNWVKMYMNIEDYKDIQIDVSEITWLSKVNSLKQQIHGVPYMPILLTEEWLLKFGFDDLGEYGWGIGYFHIRFRNIHKLYFPIDARVIRVKHVHQLQNLYFALTGIELEINK